MDMVSSASIDVELTASPYEEERKQKSVAFEYLRGKSTYSMGVRAAGGDRAQTANYYRIRNLETRRDPAQAVSGSGASGSSS